MKISAIDHVFDGATSDYNRLAARIQENKEHQDCALLDIALTLVEAKRQLPHGMFLKFLRDGRVGYSVRTAQLLMKIAVAADRAMLASLGMAKAAQLLRLTPEQRDQLTSKHRLSEIPVSSLRKLVDSVLGAPSARSSGPGRTGRRAPELQIAWAAGVLHMSLDDLSIKAVDRAFRELAHVFHPDKGLAPDGKFMRTLLQARTTLYKQAEVVAKAA
jgi:hypothetical protein